MPASPIGPELQRLIDRLAKLPGLGCWFGLKSAKYERLTGGADSRVAAYPHEIPDDLAEALLNSLPGGEDR